MLLYEDLRRAVDPATLFEARGRMPDPWQAEALITNVPQLALLCSRQIGKSETLAAKAIHRMAWRPEQSVGILAPTLRQSSRLLRRARAYLPALADVVRPTNDAATTLTLSNGSTMVAWPGNNPDAIRGETLDLLVVDEAAWVLDEAWAATMPMLAMSGGDVMAASTPGGPSGWFYEVWTAGDDDWMRVRVTAPECPRYTETELARARRALGETAFAVEFMCEWREASNAVFTSADIARILGRPVPEEDDDLPPESAPPAPRVRVDSMGDILASVRARREAERADRTARRAS